MTMIEFDIELGAGQRGKPMIPPPAKVSVMGAGRSGLAASRLLLDNGYTVYLSDIHQSPKLENQCKWLSEPGFSYTLGGHDKQLLSESDFIVLSPGINERIPLLNEPEISRVPVVGEVELAYWFCRWPIIALTGTNGKTTTVTLIDRILTRAGFDSQAAGNIGRALCSTLGGSQEDTVLVAEISSFQLHTIKSFRPRLALLLNLSPDHLERYGNLDEYYSSKMRLFTHMDQNDLAIFNADYPGLLSRAENLKNTQVAFFGYDPGPKHLSFVKEGKVYARPSGGPELAVIEIDRLPMPGRHNLENVLAATAAAAAVDANMEATSEAIASFTGLPHRLEKVAAIGGVTYINDSKSTTVDSVGKALASFAGPIVLIMGGCHKGSPYTPLSDQVREKVRHLVVIGETSDIILEDLGHATETSRAGSFEEAVAKAHNTARPGDVVLLSPGCASFDMFENYEERGTLFKEIVLKELTLK
ncbi:UDP-N-acetylmuramoyl-L-alanine--D-glutamate ligase [Gemmatimonadota bacterium]